MARGWESKSVEEQQSTATATAAAAVRARSPLSEVEIERRHRRESIELERVRVMHDLEAAHNPRYQKMLQLALAHLDQKLADL